MAVVLPADNPFFKFRSLYHDDPVAFVREVLGAEPDEWQCQVMMDVARGVRRISIRSGHGVGKSAVLAWICIWWMLTRYPQKTLCTAPTSDQLFDALAAETKSWIGKLPPPVRDCFGVFAESIVLKAAPEDSFISYSTSRPEKPEALAGRHSANMLLIGDEASGIPEEVYEAAVGSMSGESATTILAGNPVRGSGYFYETFNTNHDFWKNYHVSCEGHPRISKDFCDQVARTYGTRSNQYRVRVLGEFPLADDDTIIPADLIDAALTRDVNPLDVKEVWGLDVGRFGSDPSALARRKGNVLAEPVETKLGFDTMQLVGWVKSKYDSMLPSQRPSDICVDVIGLGAGVLDRLVELGLPARGINVSESPTIFDERYANLRAELWYGRGLPFFEARDCNIANDIPLAKELKAVRKDYTSNGKLKAESKDAMKARGEKSPNRADAFLLTLAVDAITAASGGGIKKPKSWATKLKRGIKGIV